tara:strand:+ start:3225 stop:4019 length:795 start_codon:yes stop_codon:yes gene_type:complete
MAEEFDFGNRVQRELSNIAKSELIRRAKGGSYFAFDEIRQALNNRYAKKNKKDDFEFDYGESRRDYPEYERDYPFAENFNDTARLNVPKIVSIRFEETSYFDDEELVKDENGNAILPNTEQFDIELATCSVTKAKNVVVTDLLNENGSIKQITGSKDYKISITGFLIGNYNVNVRSNSNPAVTTDTVPAETFDTEFAKPKDDIEKLKKILETNVSLEVTSQFLTYFGITNIVIQSFNFPQDFETKNIQEFTITAISDDPKIKFL